MPKKSTDTAQSYKDTVPMQIPLSVKTPYASTPSNVNAKTPSNESTNISKSDNKKAAIGESTVVKNAVNTVKSAVKSDDDDDITDIVDTNKTDIDEAKAAKKAATKAAKKIVSDAKKADKKAADNIAAMAIVADKAAALSAKNATKSIKDPNAPPRPLSSFFQFMKDNRDAVQAANPPTGSEKNGKQISAILLNKWKELDEEDLQAYKDTYTKNFSDWKIKNAEYSAANM